MGHEEVVEALLSIFGTLCMLGPVVAYYFILTESYKNARASTIATQINSSKTALFLPSYAFIMFLSLVVPDLFLPLQIPIALAEGFSFFCFFNMVVQYMGGPNMVVARLQRHLDAGKVPLLSACCPGTGTKPSSLLSFCCPSTAIRFYMDVLRSLHHFIVTRTAFVFVTSIFLMIIKYAELTTRQHSTLHVMAIIFQVISLGFLIKAFGSLVMFFEMVYDEGTKSLRGIAKIWILKFSVGLIVIQGLIEQFLYTAHTFNVQDSSNYSAEDRAQMIYCFIVLAEYFLLSYFFFWAYSVGISPPTSTSDSADEGGVEVGDAARNKGEGDDENGDDDVIPESDRPDITFGEYCSRVMSIAGVWDNLDPTVDGDGLKQPLTAAGTQS
jgi:hypothetical protein